MDPITIASSFATLVGLVVNFRQERGGREVLTHREFTDWLEAHRHLELKKLIVERAEIQAAVDSVLRTEHQQMLQQLETISTVLASMLSRIDGFRPLSEASGICSELSDQAIGILRALVDSQSDEFGMIRTHDGTSLMLTGGGSIEISEERFLSDDLDTLAEFGLLKPRIGSGGTDFYGVTRSAVKFISTLDAKKG